jgi:hypothetical protein
MRSRHRLAHAAAVVEDPPSSPDTAEASPGDLQPRPDA